MRRIGRDELLVKLPCQFLAACIFFFCATAAKPATVTETEVGQFHHSAWSAVIGAPHDIWSMAQGTDGFLWLGTGEGLYQFDGLTFRQRAEFGSTLATSNITALSIFPNGDMWAGFYLGGVALIRHGQVQTFGKADGFPAGWVLDFVQTQDGAIWAAAKHGLARYQNGKWHTIGTDWGLPANSAGWVLLDKEGNLWVTGPSSLYFLAKGSRWFQDTDIALGKGAVLALDQNGVLWVSDKLRGTRSLPGVTASHPHLALPSPAISPGFITSNRILFDRNGNMWGTDSQAGGIYVVLNSKSIADGRALHPSDLSLIYKRANGLTSDLTDPLLHDREGNVWVGTNFGLDSFRLSNVSSISGLDVIPGVDFNIATDTTGRVWALNGKTIYQISDGRLHAALTVPETIHDLAAADDDSLWFETDTDVFRMKKGVIASIGLPAGVKEAAISAFSSDGMDGVWMAFRNDGLYHWSNHHWSSKDILSASDTPTALAHDGANFWIGYTNNRIAIRDAYSTRLFSAKDGIKIGAISSLSITTPLRLAGGEEGLARLKDGRFQSISSLGSAHVAGVSGIAYQAGNFWLNTNKGVIRISTNELQKSFEDSTYVPTYKLFQYRDGLPGFALQSKPLPTALADVRGHIWVETDLGVACIDPSRVRINTLPPQVQVIDVSSNGTHFVTRDSVGPPNASVDAVFRLPSHTSNLDIEYTATSLSVPEGTRFLYKLDHVDDGWQSAGNRREAFYANLGPGTYSFYVTAQNEDGIWSDHPASITFYIPPMFYQTGLFRIACFMAVIVLILLIFRIRMNQVSENVRARINERYMERERIARELHDTLLQSVQGFTMIFKAMIERSPSGESRPDGIENVLGIADGVMVEVRDRVLDLRRKAEHSQDLPQAFTLINEEISKYWNKGLVSFRVTVHGSSRPLNPLVQEEIYCIGREAIINSYKHADADVIEVDIYYASDQFRARFRDNGDGICESIVLLGGKSGHWGLRGMKERANRISGTFRVYGQVGLGTEIELSVPSSVAYVSKMRSLKDALLRLVNRRVGD